MTLEGWGQIVKERALRRTEACAPRVARRSREPLPWWRDDASLWGLVVQQVVAERTTTGEFAGAGCFEPLGGSFAGLQLGHCSARPGTSDKNTPLSAPLSMIRLLALSMLLCVASGCRVQESQLPSNHRFLRMSNRWSPIDKWQHHLRLWGSNPCCGCRWGRTLAAALMRQHSR